MAPPPGRSEDPSASAPVDVDGNLRIAPRSRVQVSLTATGSGVVGGGTTLDGDVTVAGSLELEERVKVHGRVESGGPLHWGRGAEARAVVSRGPFLTGDEQRAARLVARKGIHTSREPTEAST